MRLVRPFLKVLQEHPAIPADLIRPLAENDPDARLPVTVLLELLRGAIELTGDEDLGLHAAESAGLGDMDVLEYAASSCTTGREALEVIIRYIPLVNDAIEISLEEKGDRVICRLRSRVPLTRAAADFQSAAFYRVMSLWLGPDLPRDLEVWFEHQAPADPSEYRRLFAGAAIRFRAPADGFVFGAAALDIKLRSADPKLHQLLRRHAEQLMAELPSIDNLADRVRRLLRSQLPGRKLNVDRIAEQLHMSRRTLYRRLAEEGITFKKLADDQRRDLAFHYLERTEHGMGEISFLLGFSDLPAFYRAFRRWTGRTPLDYRKTGSGRE
jgi:AraC-like DNA-binding protein